MGCVSEDGDGVGQYATHDFHWHEKHADKSHKQQFFRCIDAFLLHSLVVEGVLKGTTMFPRLLLGCYDLFGPIFVLIWLVALFWCTNLLGWLWHWIENVINRVCWVKRILYFQKMWFSSAKNWTKELARSKNIISSRFSDDWIDLWKSHNPRVDRYWI